MAAVTLRGSLCPLSIVAPVGWVPMLKAGLTVTVAALLSMELAPDEPLALSVMRTQ